MPYGISCASEVFQHALYNLLSDIPGLVVYIDDMLIYGCSKQEHDERLQKFLNKAHEIGLKLNEGKSQIGQGQVKFMGHILSPEGISVQESKVKAIDNMCAPSNVKELQRFLGMVNLFG